MNNKLNELESNLKKWEGEIERRKVRERELTEQMQDLARLAVNGDEKERTEAKNKRGECFAELESLKAERPHVEENYKAAKQAVKDFHIGEAENVYSDVSARFIAAQERVNQVAYQHKLIETNWRAQGTNEEELKNAKNIRIEYANAKYDLDILSIEINKARKNYESVVERMKKH